MKQRRTLIISLLFVAALVLGIGYAGFTSELSVGGEAILGGVSESEVVIKDVLIKAGESNNENITAVAQGQGTKAASVDVSGFEYLNDYALVTIIVENPHEFDVNLSVKDLVIANNTISGTAEYFTIAYEDEANLPTSVDANSETEFKVRIKANVITPDAHTSNFTVGITASTRTNG